MPIMTKTQLSQLVDPRVGHFYNEMMASTDKDFLSVIFNQMTSKQATEYFGNVSALPMAQAKINEGDPVTEATIYQGTATSASPTTYGISTTVSPELAEDDLQKVISNIPAALARSMRQTYAYLMSLILSNAYSGAHLGWDAVALASGAHPNPVPGGSNWDNDIGAVALDYSGLQTAIAAGRTMKDKRGLIMPMTPKYLVVPAALEVQGQKLLHNTAQPDTTQRNDNTLQQLYPGIKLVVDPHLDSVSTIRWTLAFESLSKDSGLIMIWRRKPTTPVSEPLGADQGFRVLTTMRLAMLWYEHKNIICSQGA